MTASLPSSSRRAEPHDHSPAVAVAGLGVVSAAGMGLDQTVASFQNNAPEPRVPESITTGLRCPAFEVTQGLASLPAETGSTSRTLQLAMTAVEQAVTPEHRETIASRHLRCGVAFGTTVASQLNNVPFYRSLRKGEDPDLAPVLDYLNTNLSDAIAKLLHVQGPRATINNACSAGADAIALAADWIRAGLCDVAIAGGADELSIVPLAGFWSLGVMSTHACRPFDAARDGLNLGEAGGALLLVHPRLIEHFAASQGFAGYLAGHGRSFDAHHLTAPHPEGKGLRIAVDQALRQAHVTTDAIALINAHGTATPDNDRVEALVFNDLFPRTPYFSTKGHTGHTLGAAGAIEAVFSLLALHHSTVWPSAGFSANDQIAHLPVMEPTPIAGRYAMSTSLAFGGNNTALVFQTP